MARLRGLRSATIIDRLARYGTFAAIMALTALCLAMGLAGRSGWFWPLILLLPLSGLGVWNLFQTQHTLMRNYPVVAHIRWIFEKMRPYLRQYIVEDDWSGRPFNHDDRGLIFARSKNDVDVQPFGSEIDFYGSRYEWVTHSIAPRAVEKADMRVEVGGPQCSRPYSASLLNISAMSFGSLGAHAVEALNLGARQGGFYHDTGEGGISPYHRKHGGDLVWEIGSGYFGCRTAEGKFDAEKFRERASDDQVRMVEIKLSQGAKPGHGGVLPAAKVSPEIAATRGIETGRDCISPPYHSAFSTPKELLEFAASLRDMAGGKPVGIKLCVGHPWELMAVAKAMDATGILLDYVVVDGAEGGTGAAPQEFSSHIGLPLREGLILARNILTGANLKADIRLAASGKVASAFSLVQNMALGADWCNAARAFMFSLGCVMSLRCHTGTCPTGVTTHDPTRQRGLVVPEKAQRVANYHHHMIETLAEIICAMGLERASDLRPRHLNHRISSAEANTADHVYTFLEPGVLVDEPESTIYADLWAAASPDSFQPSINVGPDRA